MKVDKRIESKLPNLVAMVGLPRSGKSTICDGWYKENGYVIVCPDDFRKAIHGNDFIASAEPFIWASVHAAVDALLARGHRVVVDATNTTEERRKPWVDRGAFFRVVESSPDLCAIRAGSNEELVDAIRRMCKTFSFPKERSYFSEDELELHLNGIHLPKTLVVKSRDAIYYFDASTGDKENNAWLQAFMNIRFTAVFSSYQHESFQKAVDGDWKAAKDLVVDYFGSEDCKIIVKKGNL